MSQPLWHDPDRTERLWARHSEHGAPRRPSGPGSWDPTAGQSPERRRAILIGALAAVGVLVLLVLIAGLGRLGGEPHSEPDSPGGSEAVLTTPLGCETDGFKVSVPCTATQVVSRVCDADPNDLLPDEYTYSRSGGYQIDYGRPPYATLAWANAPHVGQMVVTCSTEEPGETTVIPAAAVQVILSPGDRLPDPLQ